MEEYLNFVMYSGYIIDYVMSSRVDLDVLIYVSL